MFLVGQLVAEDKFGLLYAVFEKKQDANNYLRNHHPENSDKLKIVEFSNLRFPFFILSEFREKPLFFRPINQIELQRRISQIDKVGDFETIYFNLWRIEKSTFNNNFPKESILRGRDWHLHFMDHDLQEIEYGGFEQYWQSILPEKE